MLPKFIFFAQDFKSNNFNKAILILIFAILAQMALVIINTTAPLEQQFFGRTGRGLGFLTEFSILIFFAMSYISFTREKSGLFFKVFIAACLVSSLYSIAQRFGLDIFDWNTRTNGIIGTLGNPNFQSSFAAMALIPSLFYFIRSKNGLSKTIFFSLPLMVVIYISQSTQGYVSAFIGITIYFLIYFWYRKRSIFYALSLFSLFSLTLIIQGMLNNGLLAQFLYKPSVTSRGEMLRNSISVAKDNPIFGIGLDSLGDFYLKYKDARTAAGVNEFTDHAHNLIVNYAATGGIPLALFQALLIFFVLFASVSGIKKAKEFDVRLAILFSMWICFQAQAIISPANISMLVWNSLISGMLLRYSANSAKQTESTKVNIKQLDFTRPFSYFLVLIAIIISYPYYNVDHMQAVAAKTGNGELAMRSALAYPESTVRYSRIANAFIDSNLAPQALELGRAAAKFNPNAPSAWGLILVNNLATKAERIKAKNELVKLDPQNMEIRNFIIPE
jgi:putative inorganic carbon (HCO3(-)) transporter